MTNYQLKIDNASIHYGQQTAVSGLSLALEQGEIGCLIGPSGCGKTSLQRAIAGFESLATGHIELAGKKVSAPGFAVSPERRNVGMVFQDFALFPHLTVEKNIAFGLHKLDRAEQIKRSNELLEIVGLSGYGKRYPHELSGGQQQRVAIARAIAPKPDILLLDEPFSSLDATMREVIAKEVRNLLKAHNITAILVTHDQHEAFAIADKIGVVSSGQLQQWDNAYNLYHNPATRFVANFVGEGHVIKAKVNNDGKLENGLGVLFAKQHQQLTAQKEKVETQLSINKTYSVLIRPDDIVFKTNSELRLPIIEKLFRGSEYLYHLQLSDGQTVLCATPSHIDYSVGQQMPVTTDLQHIVLFEDE